MGNKRFERAAVGVAGIALVALGTVSGATTAAAAPAPGPGTGSSSGSDQGTVLDLLNTGSSILKGQGPTGPSGPPAVQKCNESTKSGHDGVTETIHQLGKAGPEAFVLRYETEDVPDRIEVFYQGARVADTGFVGDDVNQGTGSITVRLPRGIAQSVLVRVTGGSSTNWEYAVGCPLP